MTPMLDQAFAERAKGNLPAAIGLCSQFLRANPGDFGAMAALAEFVLEAGQIDQGIRLLELALSLRPAEASLWLALGRARLARGLFSAAAYAFRRVLLIIPGSPDAAQGYEAAMAMCLSSSDFDYHPPFTSQIPGLAQLYKSVFGYKTDGLFLEIGAFDGETHSNTGFLADIGWRGFYVEPVQESAEICATRHRHNDVEVICAAVGPEDASTEISIGGPLSSMAAHHIKKFDEISWGKNVHTGQYRTVPVLSPDTLLARIGLTRCDVFVIDVEGYEWPIVEALDLTRFRPTLVIVETRDRSPEFGAAIQAESENVKTKFIASGYRIEWRDELNIAFRCTA